MTMAIVLKLTQVPSPITGRPIQNPTPFTCGVCGASFFNARDLVQHVRQP